MTNKITDDLLLDAILDRLSDGLFHSGQELGDLLGISRTAVWKHLEKLEAMGLMLSRRKGRGYRLDGGLELLHAESIRKAIDPPVSNLLTQLDVLRTVDSTNTQALRQACEYRSGYVCLAEQQISGKGRRGRQWISPFGKNIYLSLLWQFEDGAAALEGLSLAVGVAIVRALQGCGITGLQLKWPNDILWNQRKLAGVLLEMTGDPAGPCQIVVGIGINVSMPTVSGAAIDQPWVDIQSIFSNQKSGTSISRNHLVAALLSQLLPLMQEYPEKRFSFYRQSWEALNAYTDQCVELRTDKSSVIGTMIGVSESGALRLQTEDAEQLFFGGEVSLRVVHDS